MHQQGHCWSLLTTPTSIPGVARLLCIGTVDLNGSFQRISLTLSRPLQLKFATIQPPLMVLGNCRHSFYCSKHCIMSAIDDLITRYHTLPPVPKRAVGAIVGSFVADAATRPFHWLYDKAEMETVVGNRDPEFWHLNQSPFYTIPTGRRSCYSDEAYCMLQSLATPPHEFSVSNASTVLHNMFGETSEYGEAYARRIKYYELGHSLRDSIPGPWIQSTITHWLKAGEPDMKTNETDGFCFAIPLIASLCEAGDIEFQATIASAVSMLTNSESAVIHGAVRARLLRNIICGEPEQTRVPSYRRAMVTQVVKDSESEVVMAEWKAVEESIPQADIDAVGLWGHDNFSPAFINAVEKFGKDCSDPGNFQSSVLALVTCTSYVEAVRRNLVAGGDNCSRANFLGACFGAAFGLGQVDGIPLEWLTKTDKHTEVLETAISMFEDRKESHHHH